MIAALYVDKNGPYPALPDVDCWDVTRDARTYAGPHAVVAHPPCGPWGRLRHLYKGAEHDCAPRAVEQVRAYDACGGLTVEVDQCAWGHVARKATWLYVVGVPLEHVTSGIRTGGTPTHWASGSRVNPDRPSSRRGKPVPPGIKVCSAQQRRRTPPTFAAWLVSIAGMVRR